MTFQTDKKCPYCAETIRSAAEICRFCNRAVLNAKLCSACCEPVRQTARRCRFCQQDQVQMPGWMEETPKSNVVTTLTPSFGFQLPVHTPTYTPVEPKKLPEQCLAEEEFQKWQKQRRDAIAYGGNNE